MGLGLFQDDIFYGGHVDPSVEVEDVSSQFLMKHGLPGLHRYNFVPVEGNSIQILERERTFLLFDVFMCQILEGEPVE